MSNNLYEGTLLDEMVRENSLSPDLVKQAAREIVQLIREGLLQDGSVRISNFGTFRLKPLPARKGRNPQTGEPMTIPARNTVIFTPCKALRELIEPQQRQPVPVATPKAAPKATVTAPAAAEPRPVTPPPTEPAVDLVAQPQGEGPGSRLLPWGIAASAVLALVLVLLQQGDESTEVRVEQPVQAPLIAQAPEPTPPATSEPEPLIAPEAGTPSVAPTVEEEPPAAELAEVPPAETRMEEAAPPELAEAEPPLLEEVVEPPVPEEIVEAPAREMAAPSEAETVAEAEAEPEVTEVFFEQRDYTLERGDSLWRLSDRHYTDPLLWPHIFQANAAVIDNPDFLRLGDTLTLPTLEGDPKHLTENDRRGIAEGYYLTYLHYKRTGHKDAFFALLKAKRYSPEVFKEKRNFLRLSKFEEYMLAQQPPMPY